MAPKDKSTKDKILQTATVLFWKQGYKSTSIRDITEKAKVSISAVNYHFDSKDKLFKEIIKPLGEESLESVKRTLRSPKSQEEMMTLLELFFEELLDLLLKKYEQTILVIREVDFSKKDMAESFKLFFEIHLSLVGFFTEAQKNGFVVKTVAPEFISGMIMNHLSNQIKSDEINKRYAGNSLFDPEYRREWISNTIRIILSGCFKR